MALTNLWGLFIVYGFYMVYGIICTSLIVARRNREPMTSRGWQLSLISVVWCMVDATFSCLQPGDLPIACWGTIWIENLYMPLVPLPHVLRAFMLNNLYNWNARKLTPKADDAKVVPRLRLFSAVKTYLYILLATVVVTVILTASVRLTEDPPLPLMGMAPVCSGSIAFITMAQAVIVFILFLACVGILWNSRDGFHFKTELKWFAAIFPIFYIWWALINLLDIVSREWQVATPLFGGVIVMSVAAVYPSWLTFRPEWAIASADDEELAERLPTEYSSDDELVVSRPRPTRPNFKSTADLFSVILNNAVLLAAFRKFALDLWCVENLLFFETAEAYAKISDENERNTQARVILNLYIKEGAVREINVDDGPRQMVKDEVNAGNITPHTFEGLKMAVFHQMRLDTFAKFRLSESFREAWGLAGFGTAPVFRRAHMEGRLTGSSLEEGEEELVDMSKTARDLLRESKSTDGLSSSPPS